MNLYPYTDFHELNDDWIIGQTKKNEQDIAALQNSVANMNFEFDLKADKATTYTKTEVDTLLNAKADTSSLATVATSGNYNDLINKPTIPAAQVNSDWNALSGVAQILNKPKLLSSDNVDYSQFSWDDTNKRYICTYNVPAGKELIGVLVTSKNAPQGIAVMNGYYNSGINTIMVTGWNVALATPITSAYQFICNIILRDL